MYAFLAIFLFLMFLLVVSQPSFVKVTSPFKPPALSLKLCVFYSLLLMGATVVFYYFAWPLLKTKFGGTKAAIEDPEQSEGRRTVLDGSHSTAFDPARRENLNKSTYTSSKEGEQNKIKSFNI